MNTISLFHGSNHIIRKPSYYEGKETNDYGRGFYCTKNAEMAKEWACKENTDGYVNEYLLEIDDLKILNLLDGKHTILNWIALLLEHRIFNIQDEIAKDAKDYIVKHFSIDISTFDVVIGYRADDSYFSYAQSFISNSLPLRTLSKAMKLGKLGEQIVLVSKKAFTRITFLKSEQVKKEIYFQKFYSRDYSARYYYRKELKRSKNYKDDLFVMDILRKEIKNDDPRIQRIILK